MKKKILLSVAVLTLTLTGVAFASMHGIIYCDICNTPMHWNGETHMEWGKMFNVYECMNGHKTLVRVG